MFLRRGGNYYKENLRSLKTNNKIYVVKCIYNKSDSEVAKRIFH